MEDLTQGSIYKRLIDLASAMTVNMLAGILYTLTNFFWLGELGVKAQAAVALASGPISIVMTMIPIITVGARVLISQSVGAKNQDGAGRVFNEAFGASMLIMGVVGFGTWLGRAWFALLLTPDAETAELIRALLCWYIPSIAIQVPSATMAAAIGGTGNMRASMLAQLVSVGINIATSPFLIFGWAGLPALGIAGVGLASLISSVASVAVLSIYFLGAGNYLAFRPAQWFGRPDVLWRAFRIGLPVGIQSGVLALYLVVIIQFLRPFGPSEQAAFGIGQRLMQSATLPLIALSGAASVVVGQCFGAGLDQRIRECIRAAMVLGLIATPVMFAAIQLFAQTISGIFSNDPAVIADATKYLRIVSLNLFPLAIALCCFGALTGLGNTRASLFAVIASSALLVLSCWLASYSPAFRPTWIWSLMIASSVLEMLLGLAFLRAEFRKRLSSPATAPTLGLA